MNVLFVGPTLKAMTCSSSRRRCVAKPQARVIFLSSQYAAPVLNIIRTDEIDRRVLSRSAWLDFSA